MKTKLLQISSQQKINNGKEVEILETTLDQNYHFSNISKTFARGQIKN